MAIRFKVTFKLSYPDDPVSFEVCTLHGVNKAIVIATRKHVNRSKANILTAEVIELPGDKPQSSDLIDRLEW